MIWLQQTGAHSYVFLMDSFYFILEHIRFNFTWIFYSREIILKNDLLHLKKNTHKLQDSPGLLGLFFHFII